ncbi:Peptidase S16 lon domain protein [Croceitalea dokdonensis DOKDO 023]|uniref:Peptidase S16 lon domain protein n=2 Tax=Croceitalea TaxID=574891 RepID=A0A0P7AT94_9FLAO|nr:Peptidase S16 lon domain protein [Croceitalea dokdonensis DOKDO 023]
MFPLQSIFFPGETVPLHIFEPRYRQLINDCREEALTFGIPVFKDKTIEYGTEVQLVEVVNTYEGGEMDVICIARQVFRVLDFENRMPGKLYAGAVVSFLEADNDADEGLRKQVLKRIKVLYDLMAVEMPQVPFDKFNSYAFAHKMGLSFEQEYELLQLTNETERLHYIDDHLQSTIAVLEQINTTKAVIEMNGHFKNFDPLDFEDFTLN